MHFYYGVFFRYPIRNPFKLKLPKTPPCDDTVATSIWKMSPSHATSDPSYVSTPATGASRPMCHAARPSGDPAWDHPRTGSVGPGPTTPVFSISIFRAWFYVGYSVPVPRTPQILPPPPNSIQLNKSLLKDFICVWSILKLYLCRFCSMSI